MPTQEQETPYYQTGGTLPANIPSYVTRSADGELLEALSRGEFCYVLNTRQMGKSSLIPRAAEKLRAAGHAVAIIDFSSQEINKGTEDAWYDGILLLIAEAM